MYFLINSDTSVNHASVEEIPDWYDPDNELLRVEADVDHLPEDIELVDCFWDAEAEQIITKNDYLRMTYEEMDEFIDQQQALNEALTASDTDKFNKLVSFLDQMFPDSDQIKQILADDVVTQEELQQIEDMLEQSAASVGVDVGDD